MSGCVTTDFYRLEKEGAAISECGKYRYALHRSMPIASPPKACLFIMLNPSTADWHLDDPTIRRCRNYAIAWRCTDLFVGNLFAFRTKSPMILKGHGVGGGDVVGVGNMDWIQAMADVVRKREETKGIIVCAWGPNGKYMGQDETVLGWLEGHDLFCLGRAQCGAPRHPLFMKKDAVPVPFTG